ncbi:MAG: hypothetical protein II842_06945 [Butyrivibrio sp.]|nr:hypothetical protein [Butyrivibrio sp.]
MQEDFHYYATYCAAYISGFDHEESLDIAYSAQFVDLCTKALLNKLGAPLLAATTQSQLELANARTDIIGLQDITRIWASFHFLPRDLYAQKQHRTKRYMRKYRLICGPNGDLLVDTIKLAKNKSLQAIGISMHVLADTWAHMYFAGTPSLVINNTDYDFYEFVKEGEDYTKVQVKFRHSASAPDDLEKHIYTNSILQNNENSIMNLGHGRAGHFPDYSFAKYCYLPAWDDYKEMIKDNPNDYFKAFTQMVYGLKFLRGEYETFEKNTYDLISVSSYEQRIREILEKRQLNACNDWKAFGEELSGETIEDFDVNKYHEEYLNAPANEKDNTSIGKFVKAAIDQKCMVSNKIFESGNGLAGFSKVGK